MTVRTDTTPNPVDNVLGSSAVLDELGTAIVVCDDRLDIVLLNPAAQTLLDVSENQVLGKTVLAFFKQNDSQAFLSRCLKESQSSTLRHAEFLDSSRRVRLVDCMLTPTSIAGSTHLILEFNEVNEVVKRLLENSAATGQTANSEVLRAVAHEIKNPLGGLRGAAQLLEAELDDHPELTEYTRVIVRETDRLCSLVDEMSGPQTPLDMTSFNIHRILEHVCKLAHAENPHDLKIVRDYDPSLPEVLGDQEQLIQVFINIVRNAVEAFERAGRIVIRTRVERQVTLGRNRFQSAARIDVEDNGPGIPQGLAEQIFFPLITSKPKGEGLGLAIVRQIITRHDGSVTCDSVPGRTRFTVLLKFANQATIQSLEPVEQNGAAL